MMLLLLFIFILSIFLGFELISKVPSKLHTPLMSGSNAISGITIVGALIAAGSPQGSVLQIVLGTLAVALATINVVGGYLVTDRMLKMFTPLEKRQGLKEAGTISKKFIRYDGSRRRRPSFLTGFRRGGGRP